MSKRKPKPEPRRPTLKDVMKRLDRIEKRLAELRPQTIPVPMPYPEPARDPIWQPHPWYPGPIITRDSNSTE